MMEKFMTGRPQRNRRHSRRAWPPEDDLHQARLVKRLFTPEIKRMLKDWLVRRRENPYPSRDEKKRLANQTGLTYTQICNWFANWRRKLKNSERERSKTSWGHLIKHYNTNARGNVEQFSISSEDSIWGEDELQRDGDGDEYKRSDEDEYARREDGISSGTEGTVSSSGGGCCYNIADRSRPKISGFLKNQICDKRNTITNTFITVHEPTASNSPDHNTNSCQQWMSGGKQHATEKPISTANNAKYKQKMMEKYLRDTRDAQTATGMPEQSVPAHTSRDELNKAGVHNIDNTALTKWLESAARFTPDKNNYFIEWNGRTGKLERKQRTKQLRRVTIIPANSSILQRKSAYSCPTQLELDAAEALANMAFNCRQRMLDCSPAGGASLKTVNAISS
ncbi:PREDICTED: iroquois-class homeodomain protein irx-4 isoform X1 [Rhagoletis zephyria]|uniref:iroquois-class homeodomain protein irx-4 isoform X1 n=2 Tax=Rhagoletis zephyria TaxID=28612 RepID=UPI00081134CC|nr:PREDICTED: iroquois-class homeodomain protein irx-4 isoform X1 [Rhagoletis zephyria]